MRCDGRPVRPGQGQPTACLRRHSLINRMGPCSRTPSGPAVSTDCINRPDRRLHPTNATASIYLLQRGSHPQKTSIRIERKPDLPPSALLTPRGNSEDIEFDPCGPPPAPLAEVAELERSELVQNRPGSPAEVRHARHRNEGSRL